MWRLLATLHVYDLCIVTCTSMSADDALFETTLKYTIFCYDCQQPCIYLNFVTHEVKIFRNSSYLRMNCIIFPANQHVDLVSNVLKKLTPAQQKEFLRYLTCCGNILHSGCMYIQGVQVGHDTRRDSARLELIWGLVTRIIFDG